MQLYQENLDNFLDVAQKLKIEGLIEGEKAKKEFEETTTEPTETSNFTKSEWHESIENSDSKAVAKSDIMEPKPGRSKYDEYEKSVSLVNQDYSKEELAKIVDDLIIKNGNMTVCKSCGKTSKWSQQMRQHVEIHIEGLSFPCPHCEYTFRSRNILKCHIQRSHKNC